MTLKIKWFAAVIDKFSYSSDVACFFDERSILPLCIIQLYHFTPLKINNVVTKDFWKQLLAENEKIWTNTGDYIEKAVYKSVLMLYHYKGQNFKFTMQMNAKE